jgi:predicted ATP-grasp superfamily ATP-dependent carboligase
MCNGYFDVDGRCRAVFTGRKLRQLSSTGIATLAVCERNDAVARQTQALLESLGYHGCVGVGHRYDARDGTYKLLDVNARISGVFRLFRPTDGTDVVRTCYLDLTGQPVGETQLDDGRKWLLEDDITVSIPRIRRGELDLREWLASFRGVREAQWFSPTDPRPFLAWTRASVARALA